MQGDASAGEQKAHKIKEARLKAETEAEAKQLEKGELTKRDPFASCATSSEEARVRARSLSNPRRPQLAPRCSALICRVLPLVVSNLSAIEYCNVNSTSKSVRNAMSTYQLVVSEEERFGVWWAALHCASVVRTTLASSPEQAAEHDGLSYYLKYRREGGAASLSEEGLEGVIKRDVERTFQDWDFYRKEEGAWSMGQDALAEVLLSLSKEPSIQYTQGMNFMAAVMLQTCLASAGERWLQLELSTSTEDPPDEEALLQAAVFWAMVALNHRSHAAASMPATGLDEVEGITSLEMKGFWSPGVPDMKRRVFEFTELLKARLPKLAGHFHTIGCSLDFLVSQWFSTLYGYVLPERLLPLALDIVFTMGWPGVITIAIAMLHSQQAKILQLEELDEVRMWMKRHRWGHDPSGSLEAWWRRCMATVPACRLAVSPEEQASSAQHFAVQVMREPLFYFRHSVHIW